MEPRRTSRIWRGKGEGCLGQRPEKPSWIGLPPGDQLLIFVTKVARRANAWKFTGQAKVDGIVVCDATFSAMILDQNVS